MHAEHVVLSDDSLIRTHTVAWVTGVTGAPLIEKLGLPTEKGRLKVQADLQVPGHPDVFAAGDAAAVPDVTQPGKITPPTAQHATRQGKVLARNVAASLGYGKPKDYRHRNMGLVVDLGPHYAVANPLNIQLSGYAGEVRHPGLPPVRDPAVRQSLGGRRWRTSPTCSSTGRWSRSGCRRRRTRSSPPARAFRCRRPD